MINKPLLYSFVGVWGKKKDTPVEPLLENTFVKTLFDDPINTNVTLNNEGILITKNKGNNLTHVVIIGPVKFQVTSNDLTELYAIIEKVHAKFSPENFNFDLYGISEEYEVSDYSKDNEKSPHWLAKKFLYHNLNLKNDFADANILTKDINFEISTKENKKFTVNIQPRTNNDDLLYFRITEHIHSPIGGENVIKDIENNFKNSMEYIKNNIFKLFAE